MQDDGPVSRRVALLGTPGAGKTTFLAALSIALTRQSGLGWRLRGGNEPSERALIELTRDLATGRRFPETTYSNEYQWVFESPARFSDKKRLRLGRRKANDVWQFAVDIAEIPGGILYPDGSAALHADNILRSIMDSDVIILFADPLWEGDDGNLALRTFDLLMQLSARVRSVPADKFPQHVAVCVTKFDDRRVWGCATTEELLISDSGGFPVVDQQNAQSFMRVLFAELGTGDGKYLPDILERTFNRDRMAYFITSSIGFYRSRLANRFDPDDYMNLMSRSDDDRRAIRGPVHPINVAEAFGWVCEKLLEDQS